MIAPRVFFLISIFLVSLFGCDKLSEFKEYFSSKPKQTATSPAVPAPLPAAPASDAALPDNVLAKVGNWTITIEAFNDRLGKLKEAVPEYDTNSLEAKQLVLEELILDDWLNTGFNPVVFCRYIATAKYIGEQLAPVLKKKFPKLDLAVITSELPDEVRQPPT